MATRRVLLATAVRKAIAGLSPATKDRDRAAAELALVYAKRIDAGVDDPVELAKVGTALLATLVELGLTPRARAAIVKQGGASDDEPDPLDELLAKRRARKHDAAGLDSPAR